MGRKGQVVFNLRHGGHAMQDTGQRASEIVETREDVIAVEQVVAGVEEQPVAPGQAMAAAEPAEVLFETPFNYLFPELKGDAAHLPKDDPATVVAALKALGAAMVEDNPVEPSGNAAIPAVYTYWGQFIDHDLTANTDRDSVVSDITDLNLMPIPPDDVVEKLFNLRLPTVNLDSVYGDGPTFDLNNPTQAGRMYDGIRFRVGTCNTNQGIPGDRIPPDDDLDRDLPRIGTLIDQGVVNAEDFPTDLRDKPNFRNFAFIADARNDENLIVAQFHLAFLRFHNAVVQWIEEDNPKAGQYQSEEQVFLRAQQLTRWHYQWLVVHDYLKTVMLAGIPDKILLGGPKHYKPGDELFMPLEFSVAAYRFGHSMVRAGYDHNRNFGSEGIVQPFASLDDLFLFTGNGFRRNDDGTIILLPFLGLPVLPFNWIIEWNRFVNKGDSNPAHFARKIDTHLAPPLEDLINQGNDENNEAFKRILKALAQRNLLRGYLLSIPTGQSVAEAMEINALSEDELRQGNTDAVNAALQANDNLLLKQTPLWFYVLKEAEVRAHGNSLGELGSRIVCETIIGQLMHDPESYLKQENGWDPSKGVRLPNGDPIVTIGDFLRFASVMA